MPPVPEINSTAEFDALLAARPAGQLLVVDFHATWCGPCKFIAPVIQRMADQYTDVAFVKVDVDRVKEIAQRYKVTAMPTFALLRDGTVVDTLRGADPKRLVALVAQYAGHSAADVKIDDMAPPALHPLVRVAAFAFVVFVVFRFL